MHIVGIIILLVILYNAWDYLFYVIGGIFGMMNKNFPMNNGMQNILTKMNEAVHHFLLLSCQ